MHLSLHHYVACPRCPAYIMFAIVNPSVRHLSQPQYRECRCMIEDCEFYSQSWGPESQTWNGRVPLDEVQRMKQETAGRERSVLGLGSSVAPWRIESYPACHRMLRQHQKLTPNVSQVTTYCVLHLLVVQLETLESDVQKGQELTAITNVDKSYALKI